MLHKIYNNKKYGFPLITFILFITCSIVTIPTYWQNELWYIFSIRSKPFYFWQVFSGVFEHSVFPSWFLWAHFLGNMSMLLVFGILIERHLGSKRMLIISLTAAVVHVGFFQLRFRGQLSSGSGTSGIVYAYAPIAFYILLILYRKYCVDLKKYKLFWAILIEFLFCWLFITVMSSWSETNIYHVVATIIGIVFVFIYKNTIHCELENILGIIPRNDVNSSVDSNPSKPIKEKWLYSVVILPVFVSIIIVLYFTHNLDDLFIGPSHITDYHTVSAVKANNDLVEISFDYPITEFNSIYTSGFDRSEISYSEDNKKVICSFPDGINNPIKITLKKAYTAEGHVVRDVEIDIRD